MTERRADGATRERWDEMEADYAKRLAALTQAVRSTGRKLRRIIWGLIVMVLVGLAFGYYFVTRNTEAIRVSCIIITNAVIESGAGGSQAQSTSEAGRLALERTAILISGIKLSPAKMARVNYLSHRIEELGGVVSVPDCDEIAKNPDRVEALYLKDKKPGARRSPVAKKGP
jgi:hypothetical protein